MKVGLGYDVHKLVENRKLIIGGVVIPHSKGLAGHSDADVLVHAVIDSIIGALGLGDIGKHFPDTSAKYKDIDSLILLGKVYQTMSSRGYIIGNIDCTIAAQQPKLAPFIDQMATKLSDVLKTNKSNINVKATTTENLGFEGRQEGISAQAICLLIKK